jgi:hypothetical protein
LAEPGNNATKGNTDAVGLLNHKVLGTKAKNPENFSICDYEPRIPMELVELPVYPTNRLFNEI